MTRYLLDTNILSDVVRRPDGVVSQHIRRVGEAAICTSVIVAGELRYGATKSGSVRLTDRVEAILGLIEVLPLAPAVDAMYGEIRARLERTGQVIGANDLWIAAHALALDCTIVTGNEGEFARVEELPLENWLSLRRIDQTDQGSYVELSTGRGTRGLTDRADDETTDRGPYPAASRLP